MLEKYIRKLIEDIMFVLCVVMFVISVNFKICETSLVA